MSDKPEDCGVELLITPELREAVNMVRGPSEPFAVGKIVSPQHRAAVVAFRDAFNIMEGAEQMLEQLISISAKGSYDYGTERNWLTQVAAFHEDLKATNDHIREQKLFGDDNSLKGKSDEQRD